MNAPEKVDIPIVADELVESTMSVSMGPMNQETLPEVVQELEPLTQEEETFCLAIVEYGGNIAPAVRAAYDDPDLKYPVAIGSRLLAKPNIKAQIARLQAATNEHELISAGAHLNELARIRDLAILTGNIKVAMNAERSRGEVAGLYQRHDKSKAPPTNAVQININMASKHDENI